MKIDISLLKILLESKNQYLNLKFWYFNTAIFYFNSENFILNSKIVIWIWSFKYELLKMLVAFKNISLSLEL
jgi:hypothetical protein